MDLPKLTLSLKQRLDEARKEQDVTKQYEFLKEVFEKDELAERVDGTSLKDADVIKIQTTFAEVAEEYDRPVIEAHTRAIEQSVGAFANIDWDSLARFADALSGNRQGFRHVK